MAGRAIQVSRDYGLGLMLCFALRKAAEVSMYCLNRVFLPKPRKGYLVRNILGSKMYLDLADPGVSRELIADGVREVISVASVMKELREGQAVVDVGGNIGYYALLESRQVGPRGKVYAIEPVPANRELLRRNIELNGLSNIEVHELAISDRNGVLPINLTRQRNWHSLSSFQGSVMDHGSMGRKLPVQTVTLDDFLKDKPYPAAIRMDAQGHEYEIFKGMKGILEKRLPLTIFIEFHFGLLKRQKSTEILGTLKGNVFRIAEVAIEARVMGRYRYRPLGWLHRVTQNAIEGRLKQVPSGRSLGLSIDDILDNPAILDGDYCLNICFKRS
ncbi:MAG: FkbM family methyltransferase [Chloroflexi bacterium]|nr:FkbM family methyltransferase [Chloroflexota bacterium]